MVYVALLLGDERDRDAMQQAAYLGERGALLWRPANAEHNQTFKSLWHLRKWK